MDENDRQFFDDYFSHYRQVLFESDVSVELLAFRNLCLQVRARGSKLIFAGNGASATISSHAATDFTQHANVRAIAFNDHSLITAFGNDYGYDQWIARALEAYANKDDVVVLISSSGKSSNIVNAAAYAREQGLQLVTFSGFSPNNPLRNMGTPSFWADSCAYNVVESVHLIWVLMAANLLEQPDEAGLSFVQQCLAKYYHAIFDVDCRAEMVALRNLCQNVSAQGGKLIFAGNGGSASIASHAATDFTKQSRVRTICFNDHNLMSAFSNDYGQEQWIAQCLEFYADPEDAVVLISCSGRSKNVINAGLWAKQKGLSVVTFSGFDTGNPLRDLGDVNFWIDSHSYNVTEAIHSIWIFCVADLLMEKMSCAPSDES